MAKMLKANETAKTRNTILAEQELRDYRIYESIWRNMERENNLISSRIGWGIFLTAGLLTAMLIGVGVLDKIGHEPADGLLKGFILLLLAVMSSAGAFFSWRVDIGVQAAQTQLKYLKREFYRGVDTKSTTSRFEDLYGLPRPFGDSGDHLRGNLAAMVFPRMMIYFWLAVSALALFLSVTYLNGNMGLNR